MSEDQGEIRRMRRVNENAEKMWPHRQSMPALRDIGRGRDGIEVIARLGPAEYSADGLDHVPAGVLVDVTAHQGEDPGGEVPRHDLEYRDRYRSQ